MTHLNVKNAATLLP